MTARSDTHDQQYTQPAVRRNLLAHILDGGLYMGAMQFLAATTVLPVMLAYLTAPTWLIALAPQLSMLGFMLPAILVAHWVDRMQRVKPFTVCMGLLQRLPFLFVAVALLMVDVATHRTWLLVLIVGAIVLSGVLGGFGMGAWQELVHRTVPAHFRAGMFAARNALAALLGLGAGLIVETILSHYQGTTGYGLLFLCTASGLFLSYIAFCAIREEPDHARASQPAISFRQNMRELPAVLRAQPGFIQLLVVNVFGAAIMLVLPFMAIEACARLEIGDAFVGRLLLAQMLGGLGGNLLAGVLGNRHGGRLPWLLGLLSCIMCFVAFQYCSTAFAFQLIFALLGMALFMVMVGQHTLVLELAPAARRTTCLSVFRLVTAPAIIAVSLLAAVLRDHGVAFSNQSTLAVLLLVPGFLLLLRIPEPRKQQAAEIDA